LGTPPLSWTGTLKRSTPDCTEQLASGTELLAG